MLNKNLVVVLFLSILTTACGTSKKTGVQSGKTMFVNDGMPVPAEPPAPPPVVVKPVTYTVLQQKYATFLNTKPEVITNTPLYKFIDYWLATPYKWGGTTKAGIDCSAFMQRLLVEVYNINIPRTSIEQFFTNYIERFGSKDYLSEGDLVFFRTLEGTVVSHVGLYLNNRMFVNSSSSKGVSIASLDDPYWKQRYVAAGRIKTSLLPKTIKD